MTPRRLSIARAFEAIEVDLWGELYSTLEVTRQVELALEDLDEKANAALTAGDTDQFVAHVGAMLDLRLAPVKKTKAAVRASAAIGRAWQGNKLSSTRLLAFVDELAEAERPT